MTTLAQALKSKQIRAAALALVGLPVGGWPQTREALDRLTDALPVRSERNWTRGDILSGMRIRAGASHYYVADESEAPL